MKKILFTVITFIFLLAGCGSVHETSSSLPENNESLSQMNEALQSSESNSIGFEAQYIRTAGYVNNEQYPIITIIKSKKELEQYYHQYKDTYDFSRKTGKLLSDMTIGFLDAIDKYTEEYFTNRFLVIVILEEGSSSITHEIDGIDVDGNIIIKRLNVTGMGNSDMEEWNIIIEIANEFSQNNYTVSLKEFVQ
jgi:hypothetical protein